MWQEFENVFQTDDERSEMLVEEDLRVLKYIKKEEPKNVVLKIVKISISYKVTFSDSKKAAHIMKLEKAHCDNVLIAKERACC